VYGLFSFPASFRWGQSSVECGYSRRARSSS
jgi:hypothetical protein